MSLKLGNKIGEGGCAEVFELEDQGKLIKLAKANTDYEAMKREYHNNQIAWEYGLSVPQPFNLVEVDGRPGIVLERIYGEALMERFIQQVLNQSDHNEDDNDDNDNDIRLTARLLSEIHSKSNINALPSQKAKIIYSINSVDYLTSTEKEAVIAVLETLPTKQLLCHGDPNPGNVLIRNDGKAVVIDWMDASIGNPEADLAEYIIMIRYAVLPTNLPSEFSNYFDAIREEIINIFMDEYTKYTGVTYSEVYPWLLPVAARKLSADAISEEEKNLLIQEIRRNINKMYYILHATKERLV